MELQHKISAPTRRMPKITFTDFHAHPDEVLVVDRVWFERGKPVSSIMAGVKVKNEHREDGYDYFFIDYHASGQYWVFVNEWSSTPAGRHQPMTLPEAIACLERASGVQLPLIALISPGVGIWEARNSARMVNPWGLTDGASYCCISRYGKRKEFKANLSENGTFLLEIKNEFGDVEPRVPATYLSAQDWKTLRVVCDIGGSEKLLVDDQVILESLSLLGLDSQ